ncbi:MAG: protein translocase component YidC [Deltaproteobacteria bacterium HGW-Deltaproteobacteria-12]|nr:MAG: protein translocase component YidC [Deltaproteobacteria bacterium HGW-Deltaproteobacteria-12]
MDKRTILAIVLSLAVLLTYQMFFAKPQTPPAKPVAATSSPAAPTAKETAQNPSLTSGKVKAGAKSPKSMASPKDISVETAQYTAIFSTRGGALKSFQLKGYQKDCAQCVDDIYPRIKNLFTGSKEQLPPKSKGLVELVDLKEGMPYPLAITFPESSIDIAPDAFFETNVKKLDLINAKEKQSLVFFHKDDNKIKVEKTFTFNPDNFTITLDVKISNLTNSPLNQIPKLSWQQYADPNMEEDSYGHDGPIASVAKSIELQSLKELNKEKLYGPNILWGGYESKYFIASFIPQNPSLTSLIMDRDAANMVSVSIKGPKEIIPGNQSGSFSYTLYLGPKEHSLLKSQNVGLEDAIDFGWFYWLAMPLLWVLNFLHNYIANYGLAIIILTLLIKIIFWPLGNLSYKSMKEMQNLQPKIAELKEKHKNDQAKISQETMALYKTHKVNPFGGCLPMVIQIPIFFGLYKALLYSIELRHSPLFWWIQDLSAKDPYYITPIIMGATQFIQQKMTPTMGDPMQAKIMLFMPIIFTFFFLNFPSGLVIYWLFNNVLSIGQQYYINKKLAN